MNWIQLTQSSTGAEIYVNMTNVVMIAPSRAGGSNLMLAFTEAMKATGRETARTISVIESSEEIMQKLKRP